MYKGGDIGGDFKKPALKLSIYRTIIHHAMMINQKTLIFVNSNLYKDFRKEHIEWFRGEGYKVIGVFLNYPTKILKRRVKESERDNSLLKTNDFEKLVDLQKKNSWKTKKRRIWYIFWNKIQWRIRENEKKVSKEDISKKNKKIKK